MTDFLPFVEDEIKEEIKVKLNSMQEKSIIRTSTEMLSNSIGALNRKRGKIRLTYVANDKGIFLQVADQGNGFDVQKEICGKKKEIIGLHSPMQALYDVANGGKHGSYCLFTFTNGFAYNQNGNIVCYGFKFDDMKISSYVNRK
jgi:hypothetical protein